MDNKARMALQKNVALKPKESPAKPIKKVINERTRNDIEMYKPFPTARL